MSDLTIQRIANVLKRQFSELIDMSDWEGQPEDKRHVAFLQRAVAALCIKRLANVEDSAAAAAITDGFGDNGVDAIFFDPVGDSLFIVQSKWSQDGNKPFDAAASKAFVAGVRDLLAPRFDRFNDKVRAKKDQISAALYSDRNIDVVLVTATTAKQPMAAFVRQPIDDLINELNDTIQIARQENFTQSGVYQLITAESNPKKIQLQIALGDWGLIDKPFLSYYGKVNIDDIVGWWNKYNNSLFTQNLRLFYQNSDVNDALRQTLQRSPEHFWYFNNGITVICDSVNRSLAGGTSRVIGMFTCEGASIVNGAQTVGTIGRHGINSDQKDKDEIEIDAWVQVRIISLENCPPDFGREITRAANLQNAVGNREFAAMDPLQHRLAADFALDQRKYAYKQGESEPRGNEGCSIVEATQALGCATSIELAVQVKREIGGIWADTGASPYTDLFNERLTSTHVWRSVLLMRSVDEEIRKLRRSAAPRADMVGVHMHRVILHLVFRDPIVRALHHDAAEENQLLEAARKSSRHWFPLVANYIEENHRDEY